MTTVLRITRHSIFTTEDLPEPLREAFEARVAESNNRQVAELQRIFGSDVAIVEKSGTFTVAEVLTMATEAGADVIEAVLPLNMTAELKDPNKGFKGQVIKVEGIARVAAPYEGNERNVVFLFEGDAHYELIEKVTIVTSRL